MNFQLFVIYVMCPCEYSWLCVGIMQIDWFGYLCGLNVTSTTHTYKQLYALECLKNVSSDTMLLYFGIALLSLRRLAPTAAHVVGATLLLFLNYTAHFPLYEQIQSTNRKCKKTKIQHSEYVIAWFVKHYSENPLVQWIILVLNSSISFSMSVLTSPCGSSALRIVIYVVANNKK